MTVPTSLAPTTNPRAKVRPHRAPAGILVFAIVITVGLLVPIGLLVWEAVSGGSLQGVLPVNRLVELAFNTALLAAAVVVSSLALGTSTAWLTTRTDLGGRRLWATLVALPLVIPSYVGALVVLGATGRQGFLSNLVGSAGFGPLPVPRGFLGAWLVLTLITYPYVHLLAMTGLRSLDAGQEEAARGLGADRFKLFRTITLPQLSPALRTSALLVTLYTMADFGAVSLLGFDTFTRAIYLQYAGRIDRRPATILAFLLIVLAMTVVWAERRSRRMSGRALGAVSRPARLIHLRLGGRTSATSFLVGLSSVTLALPVAVLTGWLLRGVRAGREATLVWGELANSLGVSLAAAALAVVVAIPLAVLTVRYGSSTGRLVEHTVWTVHSLPHLTVGLAVLLTGLTLLLPLYQTLPLLVFAYLMMFLAQALGPVQASLRRVATSLEEASRSLGRSALATAARVTVPLIAPGMAVGAGLVFLTVMKELPATLLLRPTGFETLAVRIWSATSEGFYTRASIAALVLLVISALPLHLLVARDLRERAQS